MAEETTEGTETGKYLTKKYLIKNLQNFWNSIKQYITNQKFVNESYVAGAINNAVDNKAEVSDLEDLEATVNNKINRSELTEALAGKVNKVEGKGLSDNNFTNVLKDKLVALPASVATDSDMGFMSGDDRQQLDRLAANAITEVDNELKDDSENPVQNQVIYAALNNKADAETLDPSQVLKSYDLMQVESNTGNIILRPRNTIKHVKLHTEKGEIIEKFYVSGTNSSNKTEIFDTFKNTDFDITIPNPDGTDKPAGAVYKFYVECLEFSGSGKYKPFILRVKRGNSNPVELTLEVFKS